MTELSVTIADAAIAMFERLTRQLFLRSRNREPPKSAGSIDMNVAKPGSVAAISWAAPHEGMTKVSVSHFTKQRQVRELSRCDAVLCHGSLLPDEAQPFLKTLKEWMDLAGFIRATQEDDAFIRSEPFTRMRELNMDVLVSVREVESAGRATALTGSYDAERLCTNPTTANPNALPIKVGLVAFFPKEADPCAIKRQNLWAPRQIEF